MPSFNPSYLASWTGGRWTTLPSDSLHGFSQDSRKLKPGQVFVALQTAQRDGHDFLANAFAVGASAALVSRPAAGTLPQLVVTDPLKAFQAIAREHRRTFRGPVIGVTGSCGKTSTKNLLSKILGGEPHVLATEGNLNNHLGVPLTLTRLEPGTHEAAVIEAGISAPREMVDLASMIEPEYGIVTLVAPAHTADLGGIAGVAREKAVLLEHIRPSGLGVFPKQCWDFAPFQDLPQTSIVVVPEGETVVAPQIMTFGAHSTHEHTTISIGRRRFHFRRISRGMAQNAALAIVLASEMGISDDRIQHALEGWQPAKWRGEMVQDGPRSLYLDFYNANPASMADALENFYSVAPADEPRLLVLGCMEELGPDSKRYHQELGRQLQVRAQDHVFVIGSEAEAVVAGALAGGQVADSKSIEVVTTLDSVTAKVSQFHGAVFVKGSRRYELEKALPATLTAKDQAKPSSGGASGGHSSGGGSAHSFGLTRSPIAESLNWQYTRAARSPQRSSNPFL